MTSREQSKEIPVADLVAGDEVLVNGQRCMVLGGQHPVMVVPDRTDTGVPVYADPETGAPFVEVYRPGQPPYRAPVTVSEVSDE